MLTPGDIESAAVAYLEPLLGVTVTTRRPYGTDWNSAPAPLVRVQVVDGAAPRSLVIDTAILSVEAWASDSVAAAALAAQASGFLNGWSGSYAGVQVYGCQATRPRSVPDPLTRFPRYLLTATVESRLLGA